MPSNGRLATYEELGGIWKEAVANYSDRDTHDLREETVGICDRPQVSWPAFRNGETVSVENTVTNTVSV